MSNQGTAAAVAALALTRGEQKEVFKLLLPGVDHDLFFDDAIGDAIDLALGTISSREARHRLLAPCLLAYVRHDNDAGRAARALGIDDGLCRRNVTYALRNLRNRCPVAKYISDYYVCDFGPRSRREHRYGRCNTCGRTRTEIAAAGDPLCPAKRARPKPPLVVKQAKPHAPTVTSPLSGADTPADVYARFKELAARPDADTPRLARAAVNKLRLILKEDPGDLDSLVALALFIPHTGLEAHYGHRNVIALIRGAEPTPGAARQSLLSLGADPADQHCARLLREVAPSAGTAGCGGDLPRLPGRGGRVLLRSGGPSMRLLTRLCAVAFCAALAAPPAFAQHGGATVKVTGRVSPVVAVSAAPPARTDAGEVQVSASNEGAQILVLSLSGQSWGATRIDIPLRLRSNVAFTLAVSYMTSGATLPGLSVVDVGGGGRFVHPGAAARVEVTPAFDGRPDRPARPPMGEDVSSPRTILRGPPISMSGTLDSPDNYVEVVLRVVNNAPDAGKRWHAELKISAAPRF